MFGATLVAIHHETHKLDDEQVKCVIHSSLEASQGQVRGILSVSSTLAGEHESDLAKEVFLVHQTARRLKVAGSIETSIFEGQRTVETSCHLEIGLRVQTDVHGTVLGICNLRRINVCSCHSECSCGFGRMHCDATVSTSSV
jgi:hypothetical protein